MDWKTAREKILSVPEVKACYDELEPEFSIARQLISLRETTGLNQRDFSQKAGIKQPQLARIESGKQTPKLETLVTLASSAGYSLELRFVPQDNDEKDVISLQVSQETFSEKTESKLSNSERNLKSTRASRPKARSVKSEKPKIRHT
jgi:transcriptional regulator with XRE-family HTH domain